MNRIFIVLIIIFLSFLACKAQKVIKYNNLIYKGCNYYGTLNRSFINKRLLFQNGSDSVIFNIKIPFDIKLNNNNNIYDPGIFYNCTLKIDSLYSFDLKKISITAISKEYNNYYIINGKFLSDNKFKFKEVRRDTKYKYQSNSGMFVDIDHEIYFIEKMVPAVDCIFQH